MKIVFMGTPDFSVPILEKLIEKHDVVAVYTRAPKESGRGKRINKTPVHVLAENKGIEVRTPRTLRNIEEQEILRQYNADIAIVAAYGLLLPQEVLDMFPKGCVNVHASILPRWRGAAPIQRAIEYGDKESGISIMQMALELDAGDVLSKETIEISPTMTGGELHDNLSVIGANLLIKTLDNYDNITAEKQDESLVTYASKLDKSECLINFDINSQELLNKIRAFNPYPAMYFMYNGERFKIYEIEIVEKKGTPGEILEGNNNLTIATKDKAVIVRKIQREGKQAMGIDELLRGFKFEKGIII